MYSIALITLFFAVFYASPKIIGYVIQEEGREFAKEINAEFTESGTYEVDLEHTGILQSFRISGSIEGSGNVKVYLEDLLVLDSDKLSYKSNSEGKADTKEHSSITGFALKDEASDSESVTEDAEASQEEQTNEQIPAEQPTEETEESQETEQNEQELPVDENLPASNETESSDEIENVLIKRFSYSCDETCMLERFNLNKSSYTIRIEISNAKLNLEKVFYKLKTYALENVTNLTEAKIQTIQGQAVVGQPVKWTERIKLQSQNANFSVKIPKEAESIAAYKIESNEKLDITNKVEILEDKAKKLKEPKKEKISSQSLEESELKKDYKEVVINAEAEEVEIEYYTPAPESIEKEISENKKQIVISGPDEIHYENVLAYTYIKESPQHSIKLYWIINDTKQLVENINYLDTNNNSLIDRIEWIVPHLSNQTYELILITKAEHLDENRNFVEDVYGLVKERDYNYSEIPAGHYLRVVFEQNLTKEKDITIYAKSSSSARIEVYEKDSNVIVVSFPAISEDTEYKVYLNNLTGEQDTFDLKVVDGSIEFDYVVDPTNVTVETEARDISLTPINKTSFVFAWVDKVRNAVSFKIYDVFGNIIVNTTDVDTNTLPDDSRVDVAMINSTAFVVGWIDGGEDDITFAIYNLNGNLIYGPTDLDTGVSTIGNATDVSVSALGDRFVVCYVDDDESDADAYTRLNNGAASAGEYNIDTGLNPDLPYQNLHSCAGINSTRFVSFHFDDGTSNDASFAVYSPTSTTAIIVQTDIDASVGTNAQVAVTNLDNNKFAMVFYDSAEKNITIAIRTIDNAVVLAPTDIDLNVGSDSRVAIATINNNTQEDSFVVVWWSQATNSIRGAIYNGSGSQVTSPFTIESSPNANYPLLDVAGKDPITGNSICDGKFIVAYVNSSGSTVFKKYNINGSEWNGVCEEVDNFPIVNLSYPPKNYFISTSGPTNLTFNASVTDDYGIVNCSLWHNATGTFHLNQTQIVTGTSNVTSFNLSNLFNVTFVWNIQCFDNAGQSTFGSENRSVNLSVSDENPPEITILGCNPSPVTLNQGTTCNATINEDSAISYVTANVTLPNSTVVYPVVSNISNNYYFTFSQTSIRGKYNITWFANDTSANNATENASFNVGDIPFVLAVHPFPYEIEQYQKSDYIALVANISDLDGLNTTKAEVTKPNGAKENVTLYLPQTQDSFDFNTLGIVWNVENSSVGINQLCVADIDTSIENKAFTSISGDGSPNTDTYCSLIFKYGTYGDFDMNVTFNITSESGVDYAMLFKVLEKPSSINSSKNLFLSIGNWTGYGRTYDVFVNDGNISEYLVERPTSDTFGKFRIKRQGDNFTFYTWNNTADSWYEEVRRDNLDMPHAIFFALEAETAEIGWGSINVSWDDMNVESQRLYTGSFSNNTEEGIYNVTFIAIDSIGLINDSEKLQFEILETNDAPSTPFILNPTPDSVIYNTQTIVWSNVYDEENDALQFNITLLNPDFTENATIISNYGNSSTTSYNWNTTLFPDGVYSLKVLVFENETPEGLSSYSIITGNFSIDNTNPQIQFIPPTPENNSVVSGNVFINVSAADAHLAFITIYNSTSELLTCDSSPCTYEWNTSGYSGGSYLFYAVAEDVNGKTNSTGYLTLRISADNPPSITNLMPIAGSTYNISESVTIQATITDDSGISNAYANITLPNGTVQQITLTNLTSNNYSASFSNLNLKGRYNITFVANDTSGNVNSTETTWFERIVPGNKTLDIIDLNKFYLNYSSSVLSNVSGILALQFNLSNYKITQIIIEGYDERSPESVIKIQNNTNEQGFENTFLIDLSNANLTSANITINSSGYHLFKCSNFNSSSLTCNEEDYSQIKTGLIPGQLYTLTLNKTDPIFGETLQGPENSTDSYIRGGAPNSNFGGSTFIRVGRTTGTNSIRGLLWFNLSHIPSNATIRSANLSLYFYSIPSGDSTGNRTHNLHKIWQSPARPWTELNATWNNYNSSNAWTTAGGDYEAIPTSNATFDSSALNSWIVFNVTSDVQNFTKNSSGNFGWIIKDSNEADTNIRRDYYSSEYSNSSFWPKLEISYTVGNTPPTHSNPILNSTFGTNLTTENLTCWPRNVTDAEDNPVKIIFNWYKNGSSIMALNLPFESSNSTFTKDYANGNNGSVTEATWNLTGGYDDKGAYEFNGINNSIKILNSNTMSFDKAEGTIMVWVKLKSLKTNNQNIIEDTNEQIELAFDNSGKLFFYPWVDGGTWNNYVMADSPITLNTWTHITVTWNYQTKTSEIYYNGIKQNLTYNGLPTYWNQKATTGDWYIGRKNSTSLSVRHINATIDEFKVFNKKLSAESIASYYKNETNVLLYQETSVNDNWTCSVTPNDGTIDGEMLFSNSISVLGDEPPVISLSSPLNNGYAYNLESTTFNASVTDDYGIVNCSLWHNATGTWHLNQTQSVTGTSNVTSFNLSNLFNVSFIWNIQCFDNVNQSSFASSNRTISFVEKPTISNLVLNATSQSNLTTDNLTCNYELSGNSITSVVNWIVNNQPITLLNAPFEGNSWASLLDFSGKRNNALVNNNAVWNSSAGFDGRGAFVFNSENNSYINFGNIPDWNLANTNHSIGLWFKATVNQQDYARLIDRFVGGTPGEGYTIHISNTGAITYEERSNGGNPVWLQSAGSYNDDKWHLVFVTVDTSSKTAQLYMDGMLVSTDIYNGTLLNRNYYLIIGGSEYGYYFNGTIDNVVIYNRTLSREQVLALYQNKSNVIVSNETKENEAWQCQVTPFSESINGETYNSNTLIIAGANQAPQITFVSSIPNTNPVEASYTTIDFNLTIYDANGLSDINFSSIIANFTRLGTTRIGSCANIANYSLYYANFSCSIDMWYFDSPGIWNVGISAKDNSGLTAQNTTTSFQYNQLQAIVLSPSVIIWQSIISDSFNQTSDNDPAIINNTGNANLTIQINATNLLGEDYPEEIIFAGNISVSTNTGGSPPAECSGTTLSAGGFVDIANAVLSPGNLSAGLGKQNLYYCIKEVGSISSQVYSTKTSGSWTVRVVLAVVALLPRRKKRKDSQDNLIKAIGLLTDELKAKYSLNKTEVIRIIAEELSKRYNLSKTEISEIFNLSKESIPATIFSKEIGGLEALCKYMHENLNMSYHEIALAINRDDRTIWTAYQKAVRKMSEHLKIRETRMILPVSIFKDRRLTVLESAIIYMKNRGLRYNEISNLINRNQKNVWTIYSRAIKKVSKH